MTMAMPVTFVVAVLLTFCASTALAQCGKTTMKVNYGQTKTFASAGTGKSSCKYRIRVPRGLHVQLTFSDFVDATGFTVYDASARPFKWRSDQVLSIPAGPQPAVFETYMVGIKPGSTPISFTYEAVVPKDGNFGFKAQASSKQKTIRSPGFPRVKLPIGVRSYWNIRAKSDRAIVIEFSGLNMASSSDYVEVYDGENLRQRHTGKLSKIGTIKNYAFSGRMRVYLHTDSSTSKGFKATYQALEPNVTTIIGGTTGEALKCHQRDRIMSGGSTLMDQHSSMSCQDGEKCGRLVVKGKSTQFGGTQLITSETLNCIPSPLCEGNTACDTMPAPDSVTVTSCQLSCCTTDFCNASPDGPEIPPTSAPGVSASPMPPLLWTTEETRLECHGESEMKIGSGPAYGSAGGEYCSPGTICGLYVFQGTISQGGHGPVAASGYVAKCVAESQCNEDACSNLPDLQYMDITSCQASCCKTPLCNDPKPRPTPSTTPSAAIRCHKRDRIMSQGATLSDSHSSMTCSEGEICGRMVIEGTMSQFGADRTITSETMKCIPTPMCIPDICDTFTPSSITVSSCKLTCCSTDGCNNSPDGPSILPPPIPSALLCHRESEIKIENGPSIGSGAGDHCPLDTVCGLFILQGTSDTEGPVAAASGYVARCTPESECNEDACSSLYEARLINITTCKVSCCKTELCNDPTLSTMPSQTPSQGLSCHKRNRIMSQGRTLSDEHSAITCSEHEVCGRMVMEGKSTQFGRAQLITSETLNCLPSAVCENICDTLPPTPGITITSCKSSCCSTTMCNSSPDGPNVPPSSAPGSSSIPYTTTPSTQGSVEECYNIISSSIGSHHVVNTRDVIACVAPNARCIRIDAVAADKSGNEMVTAYGACVAGIACGSLDCSALSSMMVGFDVKSCNAQCCDENLCNGSPLPGPDGPGTVTPPMTPPLPEGDGIQCYDVLQMQGMGMVLPGAKKAEKRCDAGSQCLVIRATVSHSAFSSIKMTALYGSCYPSIACSSVNCDNLPTSMKEVTVADCEARCCDTDFCNG